MFEGKKVRERGKKLKKEDKNIESEKKQGPDSKQPCSPADILVYKLLPSSSSSFFSLFHFKIRWGVPFHRSPSSSPVLVVLLLEKESTTVHPAVDLEALT